MDASSVRKMTSHPRWVASMYEFVTPHWDNLVNGIWAESIASGRLSIEQMQGWILQLYPFIYDFPKFLAEGLIKVEDDFARTFLIENIRIEKAHAEHWVWRVNTKGSLAEAVAATSFAIEGVAGALARKISAGFESYGNRPGVNMNPRTYKWIREHSHYDDEHPKFALEIVKHYAITERMQRQVMLAAKRSLELLNLALLTSTQILPAARQ